MILRASTLKPVPKKKRINLSAMLTSEYFFHRSIQIQMALNQDRVLVRDYLIKKAKPKINTGKKKKINALLKTTKKLMPLVIAKNVNYLCVIIVQIIIKVYLRIIIY